MRGLLMLGGTYLIVEAVISLSWANNDKWLWSQMVRVSRIIVGGFVIWAAFALN